ncbi:hypothetical protein QYE76_024932 [Lolium multiflorum]|uniref:TF-B3 domain-containing protein n=1 Tax=Lolium multiflorum TaxID=4521 RepID=A0AAD8VW52_LOLMU|nr:hypothetical protein QYE76_024932 [Lolium multiflorum]
MLALAPARDKYGIHPVAYARTYIARPHRTARWNVPVHTEKLKLGSPETSEERPSKKRRAANVGHFQPDQFLCIVFRPTFSRLWIPQDFFRWFGEIHSNIIVTTNTGCNWRMTTVREADDAYIDQGWAGFTVAHRLQIRQFLIFKKVSSFEYSVVIFDHTYNEVMTRCHYHGDTTKCVVFESHV